MALARPSPQSDKMEFRPTSIPISTGSIARSRDEARDRMKRVDDVWLPASRKEDPVSAGAALPSASRTRIQLRLFHGVVRPAPGNGMGRCGVRARGGKG